MSTLWGTTAHMFVLLDCWTPNDPETSCSISCPNLPSASYDWFQYHIPHIGALFHHQVGALTEVDLKPSTCQIPVINPLTTTCLYYSGMDMTVHIKTIGNPFTHRSLTPSVHFWQSHSGSISPPRGHKNWQSFLEHSGTLTDLSMLSHEHHKAHHKASSMFSDSLIHLGSRMAFWLDGLITSSKVMLCNGGGRPEPLYEIFSPVIFLQILQCTSEVSQPFVLNG